MYETKIKFIFFVIFSLFVNQLFAGESFESYILNHWSSSHKIEINPRFKMNESIKEPAGTKQVLALVSYLNSSFMPQRDCLVFKIPIKTSPGELSIHKLTKNDKDCESRLFSETDLVKKNIFNVGVNLTGNKFSLSVDSQKINFLMLNKKTAVKYSLGNHYSLNLSEPGLRVSLTDEKLHSNPFEDGKVCYDVDKNCKVTVDLNCDHCLNGFYLAKASQCSKQLRRVCGNLGCGGKGEPACLRGHLASGYVGNYCIPDSPIGICEKGLRVFCESGVLICN